MAVEPATRPGAGTKFDWHFDPPLEQLHFEVNRFAAGISDYSTMFLALNEQFKADQRLDFSTEGGASGSKWKELSPNYKAWKEEHYPGRPIGVLTGALRSSMTGGEGYSVEITPRAASFGQSGATAEYGVYFDEVRPVLRISEEQAREWQRVHHEWLVAEARRSFDLGGASLAGVVASRRAGEGV